MLRGATINRGVALAAAAHSLRAPSAAACHTAPLAAAGLFRATRVAQQESRAAPHQNQYHQQAPQQEVFYVLMKEDTGVEGGGASPTPFKSVMLPRGVATPVAKLVGAVLDENADLRAESTKHVDVYEAAGDGTWFKVDRTRNIRRDSAGERREYRIQVSEDKSFERTYPWLNEVQNGLFFAFIFFCFAQIWVQIARAKRTL